MLMIKTIQNDPIDSNCYIVYSDIYAGALVIDPGSSNTSKIELYLQGIEKKLDYIILTHEHFDHIWGVEPLRYMYKSPVIATKECAIAIQDPKLNLSLFHDRIGFACTAPDIFFDQDHFSLDWNNNRMLFVKTPGHSPGGCCVKIGDNVFVGDILIPDKKTVTKLPGGDKKELNLSIERIRSISTSNSNFFPGHNSPFNYNMFLKMIA